MPNSTEIMVKVTQIILLLSGIKIMVMMVIQRIQAIIHSIVVWVT